MAKPKKGTKFIDRSMNHSIDNMEESIKFPSEVLKNLDKPTLLRLKKYYGAIVKDKDIILKKLDMYLNTRHRQSKNNRDSAPQTA